MSIDISEAFGRVERKPSLTRVAPNMIVLCSRDDPRILLLEDQYSNKADSARARNSPLTVDLASLSHLVVTNSLTAMDMNAAWRKKPILGKFLVIGKHEPLIPLHVRLMSFIRQ
jgi:hypothetical protein